MSLALQVLASRRGPRAVGIPSDAYDVQRRVPATGKARDVLGFEATTTLDEMLDVVVPWVVDAVERGLI